MGTPSYYVALAFKKAEDDGGDIVACNSKSSPRLGPGYPYGRLTCKNGGALRGIAFSRTGDPALGDFEDAVILKTIGEVDIGLLST
jgi:hypothetical protein